MLAKDVMTKDVTAVKADTPVPEIAELMATRGIHGVPVVDDNECVVGMVSEDDVLLKHDQFHVPHRLALFGLYVVPEEMLIRAYGDHHGNALARDVMERKVVTFDEETDVDTIAETMVRKHIDRVPIRHGCKLAGILSKSDILRAIAET